MNSVNMFAFVSLVCMSASLHPLHLRIQFKNYLDRYTNNKQALDRYNNAKTSYKDAATHMTKDELQNSEEYRNWYGKPWNDLTEEEKSLHYPEFNDFHSKKTWEKLPSYEKEKYNAENKNFYCGQCKNLWPLQQTQEELEKKIITLADKHLLYHTTKKYIQAYILHEQIPGLKERIARKPKK